MENLLEELEKQTPEKPTGINFEFSDELDIPTAGTKTGEKEDIFSQFDQNDFFSDLEEDEPASKAEEKGREQFYKAAARQYVVTFNAIVPKVASLYSKANSENYKLTQEEQDEYEQVTEAFFASIEWHPDPKAMFIGFSSMLLVVVYLRAAEDKKRIEAEKKRSDAMKAWKTASTTEERIKANAEMKQAEANAPQKRQRFVIDKDGFFERDVNGAYIPKSDRIEKPTPHVMELIKKYEFFEDGSPRSEGQINAEIRKELYG